MNRQEFLRSLGVLAGGAAFGLAGAPVRAFARPIASMPTGAPADAVLVLVQLQGGNDGLNTIIPYRNDVYYRKRPTVAIPAEKVLKITDEQGFHPSLQALRPFYDTGRLSIVQNVGYAEPNLSHFRSTDIWMSGSDSRQMLTEGWVSRYLARAFPGFPAQLPPEPMAVQIGSVESMLTQHQHGSMGLVFDDPENFFQLVKGVTTGAEPLPTLPASDELQFLQQIAQQSVQYSGVVQQRAARGKTTGTYPDSYLSYQLQVVARLISGGMKTPVYVTTAYGYDTHAQQVVDKSPTTGNHATLLKELAEALAAFQRDLETQGLAQRVAVMTFSEFGRRVEENGTHGTDHGAGAPQFVLGVPAMGGFVGRPPSLTDVDANKDLKWTADYRQVYASALRDHLGLDPAATADVLGREFATLPIFKASTLVLGGEPDVAPLRATPNPFSVATTLQFTLAETADIRLTLHDIEGRTLRSIRSGPHSAGPHSIPLDTATLPPGTYLARLEYGAGGQTARLARV